MTCDWRTTNIRPIRNDVKKLLGYHLECDCGHRGPDRIYSIELRNGEPWYDTDKAKRVANLDKGRHIKAASPRRTNTRPRDSQRQKLYDAERRAFVGTKYDVQIGDGSIDAVQAWLDEVLKSRWFQSRWGATKHVPVKAVANANFARSGSIHLSRWGRKSWVVLHELAHVLAPPRDFPAHAKQFAGVYVFLVEHTFGAEAARRLRAEFVKGRVKHRDSSKIPAVNTERVVTKAAAAAGRKRLAAKEQRTLIEPFRRKGAAEVIRAAVAAGLMGATGTKQRSNALAVARALEGR